MSQSKNKVKIIHASELKSWSRFPEYSEHNGPILSEYLEQRQMVRDMIWEFRELSQALNSLDELDVNTPAEYIRHEIPLSRSIWPGQMEVVLPKPDYPQTNIQCDVGEVSGQVLRIKRSWRKRTVTAKYSCPKYILNADKISSLKKLISGKGEEAQLKLAEAHSSRYLQPVLFVSHRWESTNHPDPEGRQLLKLQDLQDCFVIYDYSSFPQDTTAPEDEAALLEILANMNALIYKVLLLSAPDFLQRGWCIYEYIVASMRASLVCDELNDPNFVMLRNLAATHPPVSLRLKGSGMESEIQNAKNQRILETVNTILPLFNQSKFTVERDREIVRNLLVAELKRALPNKMEYIQYVGEWKMTSWTEEELREAFTSELKWESLQYSSLFKPFEPKVPSTVNEAIRNNYQLNKMPVQNEWTWLSLVDLNPSEGLVDGLVKGIVILLLVAAGGILLLLVFLFFLLKWIFF